MGDYNHHPDIFVSKRKSLKTIGLCNFKSRWCFIAAIPYGWWRPVGVIDYSRSDCPGNRGPVILTGTARVRAINTCAMCKMTALQCPTSWLGALGGMTLVPVVRVYIT